MRRPPRFPRYSTRTPFLPMLSCQCLSLAHIRGLGVCPFSGLVCHVPARCLFNACSILVEWFAKGALPQESLSHKSISVTILTSSAWRTLGLRAAFSTPVAGHYSLDATFLGSARD